MIHHSVGAISNFNFLARLGAVQIQFGSGSAAANELIVLDSIYCQICLDLPAHVVLSYDKDQRWQWHHSVIVPQSPTINFTLQSVPIGASC